MHFCDAPATSAHVAAGGAAALKDHQLHLCIMSRLQTSMPACLHLLLLPKVVGRIIRALLSSLCQIRIRASGPAVVTSFADS